MTEQAHPNPAHLRELIDRLEGKYRVPITDGLGPAGGEEPNNADFFVRSFPSSPLAKEAAAFIEAQAALLARARKVLEQYQKWSATVRKWELLAEGVHAGLRKGSDADDCLLLWKAIRESETTAWSDAIQFALDPYFTMWGGDRANDAARALTAEIAALGLLSD